MLESAADVMENTEKEPDERVVVEDPEHTNLLDFPAVAAEVVTFVRAAVADGFQD